LKGSCETLSTPDLVRRVARTNRSAARVALDLRAEGLGSDGAALTDVGLCFEPGVAYHVPLDQGAQEAGALLDELRPLLGGGGSLSWVAHDSKPCLVALGRRGEELRTPAFDTLLAAFLLDGRAYELEDLAATRLGVAPEEGDTERDDRAGRSCARAEAVSRLSGFLEEELEKRGQLGYLRAVELPLVPVISDMELAGIAVDVAALAGLSARLAERLRGLEAEMAELVGHEVSPRSPRRLGELLYEELGLEGSRRTSSGRYSTDALAFEALAGQHAVVD